MRRTFVRGSMLVTMVVVAGPAFGLFGGDDFPLSNYPMFAADRGPETVVSTLVGLDGDGDEVLLTPTLISGNAWPSLAHRTAANAVYEGAEAANRLCREVAARVAEDDERSATVTVELIHERYDARAYFAGEQTPLSREVFARCAVPEEP